MTTTATASRPTTGGRGFGSLIAQLLGFTATLVSLGVLVTMVCVGIGEGIAHVRLSGAVSKAVADGSGTPAAALLARPDSSAGSQQIVVTLQRAGATEVNTAVDVPGEVSIALTYRIHASAGALWTTARTTARPSEQVCLLLVKHVGAPLELLGGDPIRDKAGKCSATPLTVDDLPVGATLTARRDADIAALRAALAGTAPDRETVRRVLASLPLTSATSDTWDVAIDGEATGAAIESARKCLLVRVHAATGADAWTSGPAYDSSPTCSGRSALTTVHRR